MKFNNDMLARGIERNFDMDASVCLICIGMVYNIIPRLLHRHPDVIDNHAGIGHPINLRQHLRDAYIENIQVGVVGRKIKFYGICVWHMHRVRDVFSNPSPYDGGLVSLCITVAREDTLLQGYWMTCGLQYYIDKSPSPIQ